VNNGSFVAWSWKAGGNSNTYNINDVGYATASAAGLTAGSITPTGASVNTKSGFSIVTFTAQSSGNATISHGLGNEPYMIIIKSRDQTYNWCVYHKSLTSNAYFLNLNTTAAQSNASNVWNNTTPTSSVFSLGSGYAGSGATVAYLWAEIPGFSKFGTYTGNGSTDGPMVITGFRPKYVMVKGTTTSSNWNIYDSARNTYNITDNTLRANVSNAELSSSGQGSYALIFDFLSNGFKLRYGNSLHDTNQTNEVYIYAAFAETPTQNLYGAQSNAR
jgi:hypothetical protein